MVHASFSEYGDLLFVGPPKVQGIPSCWGTLAWIILSPKPTLSRRIHKLLQDLLLYSVLPSVFRVDNGLGAQEFKVLGLRGLGFIRA